jgi:C-terminal peptidase prc
MTYLVRCQTIFLVLIVIFWLAGCSTDDSDNLLEELGTIQVSNDIITSNFSNLTLSLPSVISNRFSEKNLQDIYVTVSNFDNCRKSFTFTIDINLGYTCALYQSFYLFPENLPGSLDDFNDVSSYVEFLQESDPFTVYFTPDAFQQVNEAVGGQTARIGMVIEIAGEAPQVSPETPLVITAVLPFSHAWFDGLLVDDQIVAVNGQSLDGLALQDVRDLLPHTESTPVTLTINRDGTTQHIATQSEEHISFVLNDDIAYLNVRRFTTQTPDQVQQDFEALVSSAATPIDKVILDLRGNGGGSRDGAIKLVDYLINRDTPAQTNPIVTLRNVSGVEMTVFLGEANAANIGNVSRANFVVLIDENSASSSELTAIALKDYQVATLIGTPSFGKSVSQLAFFLVDDAGVWIPAEHLISPAATPYDQIGIAPDFFVSGPVSPQDDPQLDAAIEWLHTGMVSNVQPMATTRRTETAPVGSVWQDRDYQ